MSTATGQMGTTFGETAKKLLVEYTAKLDKIRGRSERYHKEYLAATEDQRDYWRQKHQTLEATLGGLTTSLQRFGRRVSQFIEHGPISDEERLELELRLADFEQAVRETEQNLTIDHFSFL